MKAKNFVRITCPECGRVFELAKEEIQLERAMSVNYVVSSCPECKTTIRSLLDKVEIGDGWGVRL